MGYGLRNIYDLALRAKENRIVCVPGAFIDRLHSEAMAELQVAAGTDEPPFLSKSDILSSQSESGEVGWPNHNFPRAVETDSMYDRQKEHEKWLQAYQWPRDGTEPQGEQAIQ